MLALSLRWVVAVQSNSHVKPNFKLNRVVVVTKTFYVVGGGIIIKKRENFGLFPK